MLCDFSCISFVSKRHALFYIPVPLLNWINISVLLISLFDLGISLYSRSIHPYICLYLENSVSVILFPFLNNVFFASTTEYGVPLERIGTENNIYQYSSRYKRDLEMSYIEFSSFRIIKCIVIYYTKTK